MTDLDAALARFQQSDLEYAGGLANHGPMAAEALVHLGHAALVEGLIDVYAPRLPPLAVGTPIAPGERASARGDPARLPDWVATAEAAVGLQPWRAVLRAWVPDLLDGLFAGAAHGLLRTAHAVRALEDRETPERRRELAHGLAYWAGRHQRLPGTPGRRGVPGRGIDDLFARAPCVPPERRRPGFFFAAVRALDELPSFALAVEAFGGEPDAGKAVHAMCRIGAQLYLENPQARIAYVHCVTAPSALRLLASHLDPPDVARGVGYALQAVLALHAVSSASGAPAAPSAEVLRLAGDPAEIRYRAACSLEEHAIKMAEACLREHEVHPDPVFLRAAADAALALDSGAGRGARC